MNGTALRPPLSGTGGRPPEPGEGSGGGGGGSGWVELARARNDIEAHLLAGRVATVGVEVRVVKDRSAPGAWLYGGANPWAPATILVMKTQLMDARIALAEMSFDAPSADAAIDLVSGRDWKTPVLWWSLALALGVLMTGVTLARTPALVHRCDLPTLCVDRAVQR